MSPESEAREARLAAKQKFDSELTQARTTLARLRAERDSITIALRKGELLRKYDAKLKLGFLLTGLRQRLMSLCYSLPRLLVGKDEHNIGRLIDEEVRSALTDIASWPSKMASPGWAENIDADLMPAPEIPGNGNNNEADAAAERERRNAERRRKYAAKAKEG